MKFITHLIASSSSILLLVSAFSAQSSQLKCDLFSNQVQTLKGGDEQDFDAYYRFDYKNFKKILFLNDSGIGGKYAIKDPSQLFVSSDLKFNNGVNVRVDNNALPFKEDSFDVIIMNRGLCPCKGPATCGGIDTNRAPMKTFLLGVIRILDKKRENSLAMFTGYYYPDVYKTLVPALWTEILSELQIQFPDLQFAILQSEVKTPNPEFTFIGFAISTGTQSISQKLNQLEPDLIP